jgi:hypothetical protein
MKAYLGETVDFVVNGVEHEGDVQAISNGHYLIKVGDRREDLHKVDESAIIRIVKWTHERHRAVAAELRRRQGNG